MHLEALHFTTQFCIAISDTHSRKWPLRAKDYLLDMHKSRKRASSASVIWHVVSFGQDGTYRPCVSLSGEHSIANAHLALQANVSV